MFEESFEIEEDTFDVDDVVENLIMERIEREQEKAFSYLKKEKIFTSYKSGDKFYVELSSEYGNIKIEFPKSLIEGA